MIEVLVPVLETTATEEEIGVQNPVLEAMTTRKETKPSVSV